MRKMLFPVVLLTVALGVRLNVVHERILPGRKAHVYLDALLVFVLVFLVIHLLDLVWRAWYARKNETFPLPKVLHSFIRLVLYLVALFAVLRGILNLNITPFLATSALLTMILGLALQPVLSNILSGLSLHFTKSFSRGDWIEAGGKEGIVIDTNWRETRIFTRQSNIVVIPNNLVATEKITNFSYPNKKAALILPVKVGYSAPPSVVFEALINAAKDVPQVLERPAPEAQLLAYEDFGIRYAVKFWISDFAKKYPIMSDVGRNIWYKFHRNNIEIPVALNDRLQEIMGSIQTMHGIPEKDDQKRRIRDSLLNSSLLRDRKNDLPGELLVAEDDVDVLADSVRNSRYAGGEVLFRQGEKGETCYIVTSGRLRGEIIYEENGKKFTSEFKVEPYQIFGEMSLFTGMPRTATGIIEVDSELLEIRKEDFASVLERNPLLADKIAEMISRRNHENREFLQKIKELSSQDIEKSINKHSILDRMKSFIAWKK